MVFPRPRCLTCKQRRVKCDSVRPTCAACRRACRGCAWDTEEESALPFRNENAFAQGQPRRPRKQPATDTPCNVVSVIKPYSLLPPSPSIPLEQHAFHYFAQNFAISPRDLPEIGHGYLSYSLHHWDRAQLDSSLRLALSAFSLAVFGQVNHIKNALEQADRLYIKSVNKMQAELTDLSADRIDHLIVATMLMTNYENFTYRAKGQPDRNILASSSNAVGSRLWKDVRHWEGAAGLLLVRQQRGLSQNHPFYRATRRPLIRGYILRGEPVPKWLQDGTQFGEEGPTLKLDSMMVRAADLRAEWLKILPSAHQVTPSLSVRDLATAAVDLDVDLASWCQGLPKEWKYLIHTVMEVSELTEADLIYDASVYSYTTHGHATVWMRYQAMRLIVSSIRMRLSTILAQRFPRELSQPTFQETYHEEISSAVTDMCRSVPFFFNSRYDEPMLGFTRSGDNGACPEGKISPMFATFLTWPLAVAFSTEAVPSSQKQWLQRKLRTIAHVQGDVVLQSIAEKEEFRF